MRPPQHGHGGRWSVGAVAVALVVASGAVRGLSAASSSLARAMREEGGEDIGSGEMSVLAEELQLAGGMRRGELLQHQPAKERREHAHRQKEARLA
jgi:hypothetical protein